MAKTKEQIEEEMESGEKEQDPQTLAGAKVLTEDEDEMHIEEEGFMQGYKEGEKMAICQNCKKVLDKEVVEDEFDGDVFRFCCSECATAYEEKRKKGEEEEEEI